jgi:hypothetical protein
MRRKAEVEEERRKTVEEGRWWWNEEWGGRYVEVEEGKGSMKRREESTA